MVQPLRSSLNSSYHSCKCCRSRRYYCSLLFHLELLQHLLPHILIISLKYHYWSECWSEQKRREQRQRNWLWLNGFCKPNILHYAWNIPPPPTSYQYCGLGSLLMRKHKTQITFKKSISNRFIIGQRKVLKAFDESNIFISWICFKIRFIFVF